MWQKIFQTSLLVLLVVLSGYVIWENSKLYTSFTSTSDQMVDTSQQQAVLTKSYADRYYITKLQLESVQAELDTTKELYAESEKMLQTAKADLEKTKMALSQVELILAKVSIENPEISSSVQTMREEVGLSKNNLENTVASLEVENNQLAKSIAQLQDKISYYEGNVKDIEEAKNLIKDYRQRIKLAKSKITDFKESTEKIEIAALKERDKIRMTLGNNGYFMRNGKTVIVDEAKYKAASADSVVNAQVISNSPKVDINVSIVQ